MANTETQGTTAIPTNELGIAPRFKMLSATAVKAAEKDGSVTWLKELRKGGKVVTVLAKLSDAKFKALDQNHMDFLSMLLGLTYAQVAERRTAQRIRLGLIKAPAKPVTPVNKVATEPTIIPGAVGRQAKKTPAKEAQAAQIADAVAAGIEVVQVAD